MTKAHVEKFTELVSKDPEMLAKIGFDKATADAEAAVNGNDADAAVAAASLAAFITNAVKEAKAHGLEFTEEEAHAFMEAEAKAAASGELSDTQLEAVAGGKGGPKFSFTWKQLSKTTHGPNFINTTGKKYK